MLDSDWVAYEQGFACGFQGGDNRECPYEGVAAAHAWLNGFAEGVESKRTRDA